MKFLGYLLLAGVVLCAVQAALSALVVVLLILLVIGIFAYPAETFGFLLVGMINWLFHTHPIAAAGLVGLLIVSAIVLPTGPAKASEDEPIDTSDP